MCHQQSATVLINKVLTNVLVYYVLVSKVLKIYMVVGLFIQYAHVILHAKRNCFQNTFI